MVKSISKFSEKSARLQLSDSIRLIRPTAVLATLCIKSQSAEYIVKNWTLEYFN